MESTWAMNDDTKFGAPRVLGIVGSLRNNSFNRALLEGAAAFLPEGMEFEAFEINDLPHYNQDVEDTQIPQIVETLRQKVHSADAILIATPEYNGSVTGALKDALDWASRPYGEGAFEGKPVALIIGVSGNRGGRSAANHLSTIMDYMDARMIGEPLVVQLVSQKFNSKGRLIDTSTISKIKELVSSMMAVLQPINENMTDSVIQLAIADPILVPSSENLDHA